MKISICLFVALGLFNILTYNFAIGQVKTSEITYKDLDSLIMSKVDVEKISEMAKEDVSRPKTRGQQDPCDADFDNIGRLFKNLKVVYFSCCKGESNPLAVTKVLTSIYRLLENSKCKWDDRPIMWAAILLYWIDFESMMEKYKCCQ